MELIDGQQVTGEDLERLSVLLQVTEGSGASEAASRAGALSVLHNITLPLASASLKAG